jgi:hypothetical protein
VVANRSRVWILLIQLAALCARADPARGQPINIYVYNQARVPSEVLAPAEQNARRIFRLSGLEASWVNCSTAASPGTNCTGLPQPGDVVVQIVREARNLKDDVFGAAFLGKDGTGQYTDVYFDRLDELRRDWGVPLARLLAHVMAHEIGHVLLGLNSHSTMGIMRGFWEAEDIKALERGRLLFSSQQSKVMREHLTAMLARTIASTVIASSGSTRRLGTP